MEYERVSGCRILLASRLSGHVSRSPVSRAEKGYYLLGIPSWANFSDISQTHNSWQPSDSFLFSYPLGRVVTLTGSGELIPAPTGQPVGKHRAPAAPETEQRSEWSLGPWYSCQPGFSVWVNTALAEEVVNHTQRWLNFSLIFCNNRRILRRIISDSVIMRRSDNEDNHNDKSCEMIKRRWAMFCQS